MLVRHEQTVRGDKGEPGRIEILQWPRQAYRSSLAQIPGEWGSLCVPWSDYDETAVGRKVDPSGAEVTETPGGLHVPAYEFPAKFFLPEDRLASRNIQKL